MSLVNTETGELVEPLTEGEAERLTNRIGLRLDTIADNYTAVVPMIREAVERNAWSALGYRSPGEYAADRFGNALSNLGPEFRQAVVRELADLGMSIRAIAPVVGASKSTVATDLAPVQNWTPQSSGTADAVPEPEGASDEGPARPAVPEDSTAPTPEGDGSVAAPTRPPVVGIDGKTYMPPAPKPPKPVLDGNAAEYANAEQAAKALSRAIAKLLEFEHPNMRAGMRRYWDMASIEVPPAQRADVTPEQMRVAAHGLLALADEWTRR